MSKPAGECAIIVQMPGIAQSRRRTVLVTGGARRIGRAISLAFANAGYRVVIHCNRSVDDALALAREIDALRDEDAPCAFVVNADLSDPAGCDAVIDRALDAAGRLDVLVNNAAIFTRTSLADSSPADFVSHFRLNALAPALLARRFLQRAGEAEDGGAPARTLRAIVNVLDQRIVRPRPGCIPYEMSKIALEGFTRAAAVELAPFATVNAVAPGAVLAPGPDSTVHEPAGAAPLGRMPTPEAVAEAVVWLAANPFVTGQTLFVDSGQHLA